MKKIRTTLLILAAVTAAMALTGCSIKKQYDETIATNTAGQTDIIGSEAPDFTVATTDGGEYTLSEVLKEKEAVVLNSFATWCGPCEREFPVFEEVYQEQGDRISILAVSGDTLDTEDDIVAYKADHDLSFPMAYSKEALSFIPSIGYPTTAIVDRNGKIMFCQSGLFVSRELFELILAEFTGDGYAGKPVFLYTFIPYAESEYIPGVSIKAVSDDGSETSLITNEHGIAYIMTNEPHTYTVEVTEVPEDYKIPSETQTAGPESGLTAIKIH